mgnify:CR=1 FL=1
MQKRNDIVLTVISSNEELKWFFNWYLQHNNSLTLPYHNLNHTLEMMQLVIDIVQKSRDGKYGIVLTDQDMFILLLSAMFHDYNHSGGRHNDSVNIDNAKIGLKTAIQSRYTWNEDTEKLYNECSKVISATEYPYKINTLEPKQLILRELDILVVLYDDFLTQSVFGLAEEMKWQDFLMNFSKYTKFLLESFEKLSLQYSIDLFDENKDVFLKTIENFISCVR